MKTNIVDKWFLVIEIFVNFVHRRDTIERVQEDIKVTTGLINDLENLEVNDSLTVSFSSKTHLSLTSN